MFGQESKEEAAKTEVSDLAVREGGVLDLIFKVEYSAVTLPAGTPPEVVSAWIRLGSQGVKDIDTIERWLDLNE